MQESVSILKVTRESVSGTTSHVHASERAHACNEIEGLYDKINITIVPSYTGKHLLPLALLLMLRTRNKTDTNSGQMDVSERLIWLCQLLATLLFVQLKATFAYFVNAYNVPNKFLQFCDTSYQFQT